MSAVYCCVQYICDFVSGLPVYVYDKNNRKRVENHPLQRMLGVRPNAFQTPSAFTRYLIRSLLLRGNGYAFNVHTNGRVTERIPLNPDRVTPRLEKGKLLYYYNHPEGDVYPLSNEDITHYKLDTDDGITGVSVLRYAARTINRARDAGTYESAVYRNNSRPGGILHTDSDLSGNTKLTDEAGNPITIKQNVRRAWEKAQGGPANAFKVAILDNGLKYEPIKLDAFDAAFISAQDLTVADIARFFGVPLHALMTGKQSYSSNEQNSLEFVQGRGLALLRMMEEEDSYKLLLDSELLKGWRIKHNLEGRLRGDTAARATFYKNMREIGAFSVNDILKLEDLPDVDGGDTRMASLNYVPLDKFTRLSEDRNKEVKQ